MNRKLKSLLAMVCVLALTLAMSVCAFAADTVTEDEAANYKSAAETLISQIAGFSDEEIENYLAQDDAFTTATMESWKSVKDELGAYSSIVSQDVEKDGDVVTISTVAQFEKAKADVVLMLDLGQQMYTSMTYSVQYSLAANMQRAGNEHTDGNRHRISDAAILKLCDRTVQVHREIPECRQEESRRGSTESRRGTCTGQRPERSGR